MSVIAVFNQKGGVGKTTTTLNVAVAAAHRGLSPIAIDLDPQAHLTLAFGLGAVSSSGSAYAFFAEGKALSGLLRMTPQRVRVLPASLDLSKVDALHAADPGISGKLKQGIGALIEETGQRGPIFIDCCPMLGVLTLNALIAADSVLIPVSADYLSLQGVHRLDSALNVLESRLGRKFVRRVLITRFDGRRRLAASVYEELSRRYGTNLCTTRIVENVALAESPMHGHDIFSHAPASPGARDYRALTEELGASGFFN
ncbi:MAG: ParA family protein [Proteobacteria bacterium]|nr:ParA family protein [Burkholderiales bacterium]